MSVSPDEKNPPVFQNEEIIEVKQFDDISEDVTIKSLLTIKSPLIFRDESLSAYNIINISIKIYFIIIQLLQDRGEVAEKGTRIIKTLLTVLNTQHGKPVLEHLLEYGAYTFREIQIKLGVPKATISNITDKLRSIDLIEDVEIKPDFKTNTPGPPPLIRVLKGTDDKVAIDCLYRHYDQIKPRRIDVVELKYGDKIESVKQHYREKYPGQYNNIPKFHYERYVSSTYPELDQNERAIIVRHTMHDLSKEPPP